MCSCDSVTTLFPISLRLRGYASHERGALNAVVQARNAAAAAQGPMAKAQAESVLSGALRQLFALAEAYPDLKANSNFQRLQTDLTGIENKLAAAVAMALAMLTLMALVVTLGWREAEAKG